MSCKVIKRVVEREITSDEFKAQKAQQPYASLRQSSKSLNFLMLFNGSAKMFADNALKPAYTPAWCRNFIKENHLEEIQKDVEKKYVRESKEDQLYITCGTYMKNNFFKAYPGLLSRIKREQEFAKNHGYVRAAYGAKRSVIELLLEGNYDREKRGGYMRNLDNICANTNIQNLEACIIHPHMKEISDWLSKNHMKSYFWNCVHDSADFVVHKDELKVVSEKISEIFERQLPEMKGIPLPVDFEVADVKKKGEYYKGGESLEAYLADPKIAARQMTMGDVRKRVAKENASK